MMLTLRYFILVFVVFGVAGCASKTSETTTAASHVLTAKNTSPLTKHSKANQQYIIHIETDMDDGAIANYLTRYSLTVVSKITSKKYLVVVDPAVGIERVTQRIKTSQYIRYIQINAQYRL